MWLPARVQLRNGGWDPIGRSARGGFLHAEQGQWRYALGDGVEWRLSPFALAKRNRCFF